MTALNLLTCFAVAMGGTAAIGLLARMAISYGMAGRPAGFGGFCLALGWALAKYSYAGPLNGKAMIPIASALGGVAALLLLWAITVRTAPQD